MRAGILAGLACAGLAEDPFRARRDALRQSLDGAAAVLFGRDEPEFGDVHSRFFQDSNFFYLSGWEEPGAVLLITGGGDTLFLPARNAGRDRFTGRKTSADEPAAPARTGFASVRDLSGLDRELDRLQAHGIPLSTVPDQAPRLARWGNARDLSPAIARLRMVKSAEEIARIRRSVAATVEGHRKAWQRLRPGLLEYQIAATLTGSWLEAGCERNAYVPIVAGGLNGATIHYNRAAHPLRSGDLVLMDAGASCGGYAADVTRTVPVSGRFTPRQRELYEIVLAAQRAAMAAVRPGAVLHRWGPSSIDRAARDVFARHGLEHAFPHDIGHHVGLDVHDLAHTAAPLEPGMVLAIEPGIYLPEENIGIRVEDMVLVTRDGCEILTSALPKSVEAIEQELRRTR